MNKRAQFFIIAALVVSSIIVGTSAIKNQAQEEVIETATVDLSQEISYEAHQVLDNGVFTGQNQAEIEARMRQLVDAYGASNPDSDIQIIFGQPDDLQQIVYDTSLGSKVQAVGDSDISLTNQGQTTELPTISSTGTRDKIKIKIELPDEITKDGSIKKKTIERELSLSSGQNVYIIVKKKIRNDQTVSIQP